MYCTKYNERRNTFEQQALSIRVINRGKMQLWSTLQWVVTCFGRNSEYITGSIMVRLIKSQSTTTKTPKTRRMRGRWYCRRWRGRKGPSGERWQRYEIFYLSLSLSRLYGNWLLGSVDWPCSGWSINIGCGSWLCKVCRVSVSRVSFRSRIENRRERSREQSKSS